MYHFISGRNLLGTLLRTGAWGIFHGYLAICTNGIAFPTGLHFLLNLGQAIMKMKEPYQPIWRLVDGEVENNYFNFQMDDIGFVSQLLILFFSVLLIELSKLKPINS